VLTIGSGLGFSEEGLFDQPTIQVRVAGNQSDYSDAEKLAQDLDRGFFALGSGGKVNGKKVVTVWRIGGGPAVLLRDAADRTHFTANYIWEVQYG
jgi:hypothetical protein